MAQQWFNQEKCTDDSTDDDDTVKPLLWDHPRFTGNVAFKEEAGVEIDASVLTLTLSSGLSVKVDFSWGILSKRVFHCIALKEWGILLLICRGMLFNHKS